MTVRGRKNEAKPPVRAWRAVLVSCALLCSAAARPPAAPAGEPLIIEHGPRDSKKIALTFDACRTSMPDDYDGSVVDILLREQVHATIFMSGRWAERNADKAAFLASRPQFEIANHAYWHPHLLQKDDAVVLSDLGLTQTVLQKVTGKVPRYFRPPYGEVDERVARLAAQVGLVTIQYDIASGDPDPKLKPERIARAILRDARGGSIIVFHANRHGVHTAELLPQVISGLRQKGFELVTVGEMLGTAAVPDMPRSEGEAEEEVTVPADRSTSVATEEYE